jgi:hypothetical protein
MDEMVEPEACQQGEEEPDSRDARREATRDGQVEGARIRDRGEFGMSEGRGWD